MSQTEGLEPAVSDEGFHETAVVRQPEFNAPREYVFDLIEKFEKQ